MQVRYRYRIYPEPGQQKALARVFGCARVVFNDCLQSRDACHAAGDRLTLYQVHSLTLDSGLFTDAPLLAALSRLRAEGVIIGLSASGPHQAETIRRALSLTVDGQQLFRATELS